MYLIKSFLRLLTPRQLRSYAYLQVLLLFTAIFQVAGIASIAPFIALLSNPGMIHSNKVMNFIYVTMGFKTDYSFMSAFALAIMIVILLSNAIMAFSSWRLLKFSIGIGASLQNRIYTNYINNDYVFFSRNNSAKLIPVITIEAPRFAYMVLQPFLHLTSQLLIALIIVAGLFYIDYTIASISMLIIGGIYLFIFKLLRNKLGKYGTMLSTLYKERMKILNESLGGIKEVKLLGTESWYTEQYISNNNRTKNASTYIGLAGEIPRYIVETIIFIAILLLALFLINKYGNSTNVVSILSLYAIAGYKLLPAVQTIYKAFSDIKANSGVVEILHEKLKDSEPPDSKPKVLSEISFESYSIALKNVFYTYPGSASYALNNVSLTIPPNKTVAFVGGSGAGKSTAVDVILGLLYPDKGELQIGGITIDKSNVGSWRKHIGYVPQTIYILDDTITNNIAFGIPQEQIDLERVKTAARMANIEEFILSRPEQYDFVLGERGAQLSGGQKQRIGIARALYHDTNVLILDEATSALDSITESQIMAEIMGLAKSRTVIIIAHRLSTVTHADNVVFFDDGQVKDQGTFQELRKRNQQFDELVKIGLEKPDEVSER